MYSFNFKPVYAVYIVTKKMKCFQSISSSNIYIHDKTLHVIHTPYKAKYRFTIMAF